MVISFISSGNYSCSDESWASEHLVSPSSTIFHDYLISVYWAAATTTTVGFGDLSAHTPTVRYKNQNLVIIIISPCDQYY